MSQAFAKQTPEASQPDAPLDVFDLIKLNGQLSLVFGLQMLLGKGHAYTFLKL